MNDDDGGRGGLINTKGKQLKDSMIIIIMIGLMGIMEVAMMIKNKWYKHTNILMRMQRSDSFCNILTSDDGPKISEKACGNQSIIV